MANFDCFVRIYLPLDSNGKPKPADFGQYDLQINSINGAALQFDSHTSVVNPVFSYCNVNGHGYIAIFNEANTRLVYPKKVLMCKLHFTATSDEVQDFVDKIKAMSLYHESNSTDYCSAYWVGIGGFENYTAELYNSFGATAIWCDWLGLDTLRNIYEATPTANYMNYSAWAMLDEYYDNWQFTNLYG